MNVPYTVPCEKCGLFGFWVPTPVLGRNCRIVTLKILCPVCCEKFLKGQLKDAFSK